MAIALARTGNLSEPHSRIRIAGRVLSPVRPRIAF